MLLMIFHEELKSVAPKGNARVSDSQQFKEKQISAKLNCVYKIRIFTHEGSQGLLLVLLLFFLLLLSKDKIDVC